MRGMRRLMGTALLLGLSVAVVPLQAQRGQGRGRLDVQRAGGPNMGHPLELALANQEDLELSQDQVVQLQELKAVLDVDVAGLVEKMDLLREQIRAGDVARDDGMRGMGALRGELITAMAPLRGRIREILTVEQHNKLQPNVRQGRPRVGRAGAFGQGRAITPGGRGAIPGIGSRPARQSIRYYRGGRRGGLPVDPGKLWNLP